MSETLLTLLVTFVYLISYTTYY